MKKLIEFYPCPGCGQNIFAFLLDTEETETTGKPYLILGSNLTPVVIASEKVCFFCNRCESLVFYTKFPYDNRQNVFLQKIKDFIRKHPEKIDKKFKEIWGKFLKQEIKSRLKEINS